MNKSLLITAIIFDHSRSLTVKPITRMIIASQVTQADRKMAIRHTEKGKEMEKIERSRQEVPIISLTENLC